jgi:hypothetical protein
MRFWIVFVCALLISGLALTTAIRETRSQPYLRHLRHLRPFLFPSAQSAAFVSRARDP